MGLLSDLTQKIKGIFSKNKTLNSGNTQNTYGNQLDFLGTEVQGTNPGEIIYFRDAKEIGKNFLYQDGQKTTLFTANIYRHDENSNNAIMLRGGFPICFEAPIGTTIEQLISSGWLQYMLNTPQAQDQMLSDIQFANLGRIDFEKNSLEKPHSDVNRWIEDNLNTKLREEIKIKEAQRGAAEAKIVQEAISNPPKGPETDYREAERMKNKKTPRFTGNPQIGYELNSMKTGNIMNLTIQGTPAIVEHRDGSRDYVYSAKRTDREVYGDAMMLLGDSFGPNIQFSLPIPIEEMYMYANDENNPENARAITIMMQQLLEMPKYPNSIFVGGIRQQDGVFVFADQQYNQRTMGFVNKSNRNITRQPNEDRNPYLDL